MENLSAGDVLAMTKNNDGFLEGNGIIILILFFLIFGFGGNGFGNSGNALTQAELQAGLYNQTTDRNLSDIRNAIGETNVNMLNGFAGITNGITESRYTTQLGFQNLGSQMQSCCCDIKTTIIEENNKTREMINANYISGLQTALSDEKAKNSNLQQSNQLLGVMGKWYANPYYSGCPYSGTTI